MANNGIQILCQLVLAVVLGAIIGAEREKKGKEAGFQTYSLVSLGSCLFAILALKSFDLLVGIEGLRFDPARIIIAIATGIGFIGAGVIIYRRDHIEGITTAAGLWAVSAIGVAVALQQYITALLATLLTFLVLAGFAEIENKIFKNQVKNR